MQRLGYTKYVAQGGDWGNAISEVMALQQPPGLLGIHTNWPHRSPRCVEGTRGWRPAAGPASRLMKNTRGINSTISQERVGLRPRDEQPPADFVRNRRFSGWPCGVDDRP